LEVLNPASLPESSIAPNRLAIAAAGLVGGLLRGVFVLRLRPRRAQASLPVAG
jgi:uncharacterized protein involved in exopolysaccharide biosynthesis